MGDTGVILGWVDGYGGDRTVGNLGSGGKHPAARILDCGLGVTAIF